MPIDPAQRPTSPLLPEPKWIEASDFGISSDAKDVGGLNPQKECDRINETVKIKLDKLNQSAREIFDRQKKLEETREVFEKVKTLFEKMVSLDLWDKYTPVFTDDGASYVDVYGRGACCEFTLFIDTLATETAWIETIPFYALGREVALNLPQGNLVVNGENIKVDPTDSIKDLTTRLNARAPDLFKVMALEINPPQNGQNGSYQLSFQKKTQETPYVRDDQGGSILSVIGVQNVPSPALQESARFKINGVSMNRDSNRIEGVVDGVTITLKKAMPAGTDPITVKVTPAIGVIKKFLTEIAKSIAEYEALLEEYVPLEGQPGPLTRFSFLRDFFNHFKTEMSLLHDGKTDSTFGLKKISGQWIFDDNAFDESVQDYDELRKIFIGFASKEDPKSGSIKRFVASLKDVERGFREGVENFEQDLNHQKSEAKKYCDNLEVKRKSLRKSGVLFEQQVARAETQRKFRDNMLDLMLNNKKE